MHVLPEGESTRVCPAVCGRAGAGAGVRDRRVGGVQFKWHSMAWTGKGHEAVVFIGKVGCYRSVASSCQPAFQCRVRNSVNDVKEKNGFATFGFSTE